MPGAYLLQLLVWATLKRCRMGFTRRQCPFAQILAGTGLIRQEMYQNRASPLAALSQI